jgi:mono/diheme cytochrome c family protein
MRHATIRTVILSVIATCAILFVAGLVVVYGGFYDVAASDRHWPVTQSLLDVARTRSIAFHAQGIPAPNKLDAPSNMAMGVDHFAAHCAVCHGAPGVPRDDIAEGMYPQPPDLNDAAQHDSDAQLFWILKNGIKMTGMPSWADHGDDDLWAIVAFLKKLPNMSEADYAKLVMDNAMHGMIHEHGGGQGGDTPNTEASH